jgi:hypothetical protein
VIASRARARVCLCADTAPCPAPAVAGLGCTRSGLLRAVRPGRIIRPHPVTSATARNSERQLVTRARLTASECDGRCPLCPRQGPCPRMCWPLQQPLTPSTRHPAHPNHPIACLSTTRSQAWLTTRTERRRSLISATTRSCQSTRLLRRSATVSWPAAFCAPTTIAACRLSWGRRGCRWAVGGGAGVVLAPHRSNLRRGSACRRRSSKSTRHCC